MTILHQDGKPMSLRAYMSYSRNAGPHEGAVLVFHHTAKEARKMAWDKGPIDYDNWLDVAVKWMKAGYIFLLADQAKLHLDKPHLVDNPAHCQACGIWGEAVIDGWECAHCGEHVGEKLAKIWQDVGKYEPRYCTVSRVLNRAIIV